MMPARAVPPTVAPWTLGGHRHEAEAQVARPVRQRVHERAGLRLVVPRRGAGVGRARAGALALVRDELEQRPVGVGEVDARAGALGAGAGDGARLDLDRVALEVVDRLLDRAGPDETQV